MDFGVPQHRPRAFFGGVLRAEMRSDFASFSQSVLSEFVKRKLAARRIAAEPFREFLERCGLPVRDNVLPAGWGQLLSSASFSC